MEKIYKCEFCGTNATVINSRGGCISCGAPIKRENIEMPEERVERYDSYPYREPYRGMVTSASCITFAPSSGSLTMRW